MSLKTMIIAAAAGLCLTACATTQTSGDTANIRAIEGPSGTLIAVDENGNDVSDTPNGALLLELLKAARSASATETPQTNTSVWDQDDDGNLTHIRSGGICPLEWGNFVLNKPSVFKADGSDVGCNFISEKDDASFTFYFYKNTQSLVEEMAGNMDLIRTRVPMSKSIKPIVLGPNSYYIADGVESTRDSGVKVRDSLFMSDDAGWRVKLRMTYPAAAAREIEMTAATMLQGQLDRVGRDSIGDDLRPPSGDTEDSV